MAKPSQQAQRRPVNTGAAEKVGMRYEFYRDNFRILAGAVPVLTVALLVSISLNVMLATRKPQMRYFATDQAGRLTKMQALSEPYRTDAYVTNWVTERVTAAHAIDFQNYRRQLTALQPSFTPEGYDSYVNSMKNAGTIDLMVKNLLVETGVPTGVPVVIERGLASGVVYWKVQIPMSVEFRSALKSGKQQRMVEITVVQRDTLEHEDGIAISKWVESDT